MTNSQSRLRVVDIIDPVMCLRCNCAHIAEVLFTDGNTRKMFYCSRLDCDNWKLKSPETNTRGTKRKRSRTADWAPRGL